MSESAENLRKALERPGTVVVFDFDDSPMVATYAPGAVDVNGALIDCGWVDSYGGTWRIADILAGNPRVATEREA